MYTSYRCRKQNVDTTPIQYWESPRKGDSLAIEGLAPRPSKWDTTWGCPFCDAKYSADAPPFFLWLIICRSNSCNVGIGVSPGGEQRIQKVCHFGAWNYWTLLNHFYILYFGGLLTLTHIIPYSVSSTWFWPSGKVVHYRGLISQAGMGPEKSLGIT